MEILKWLFRLLTFIGIVALIIIKSKKKALNKAVLAVCIVSFIASVGLTAYPIFNHTYYDRLGNSYGSLSEVKYYTSDGSLYTPDEDKQQFICKKKSPNADYKDEYDFGNSYVDSNGYLVFIEKELDDSDNSVYSSYDSQTGEYYTYAAFAKWDKNGKLQPLNDSDSGIFSNLLN